MAKGREKRTIQETDIERNRALGEGARFRGDIERRLIPGYEEFAKTGGYTPGEKEEIRQRTSSALSSLYGDLQRRLEQRRAMQGGYAPGFGAQEAALGRDFSEREAEALRDTDIGIAESVRSGRLAGLGGLEGAERLELAGMGLTDDQIRAMLGIRAGLATRPGLYQNILAGIDTATGGASVIP